MSSEKKFGKRVSSVLTPFWNLYRKYHGQQWKRSEIFKILSTKSKSKSKSETTLSGTKDKKTKDTWNFLGCMV